MPKSVKITDHMLRYLEAKTHLWNVYFRGTVTNLRDCEPLDSFEAIDRRLFYALVSFPLGFPLTSDQWKFGTLPAGRIAVKAKPHATTLRVMFRRPSDDGNAYWEPPENLPRTALSLSFVEFFQWYRYHFHACTMLRCRVEEARDVAHVGREVLVEEMNSFDFYFVGREEKRAARKKSLRGRAGGAHDG